MYSLELFDNRLSDSFFSLPSFFLFTLRYRMSSMFQLYDIQQLFLFCLVINNNILELSEYIRMRNVGLCKLQVTKTDFKRYATFELFKPCDCVRTCIDGFRYGINCNKILLSPFF